MRHLAIITLSIASALAAPLPLLIDFDKTPALPQGPSLFSAAGNSQTITLPGVATFTGGVILGNAVNFAAEPFGTSPNAYATTNQSANSTLLPALTITFDPTYAVGEVSFPVFNGLNVVKSYVVTAYSGATVVGTQTLNNIPSAMDSGYSPIDILANNITSVVVTPTDTTAFDFLIDSVALNESIQTALPPSGGGTGVGGGGTGGGSGGGGTGGGSGGGGTGGGSGGGGTGGGSGGSGGGGGGGTGGGGSGMSGGVSVVPEPRSLSLFLSSFIFIGLLFYKRARF